MDGDDGQLIGRGRACDVYAAGPGRVRRRYREPHPGLAAREFAVMRHLAEHGFPVPAVLDHADDTIEMERVEGPTMLARLAARPWEVDRLADVLALLHRRLAAVPVAGVDLVAPFAAFAPAECVAHLDLHPDNVILSPGGPVVIDWTNTCLAPAGLDIAATWVVTATGEVDAPPWVAPIAGAIRRRFVGRFVDGAGRDDARRRLALAGARRLDDPHTSPAEADRVRALMVREGVRSAR